MPRTKIVFFDVNETLLDLQPIKERIGQLLGDGPEIARLWFTTLLQHSLVVTVSDRYTDFAAIGEACLRMVARTQGNDLSEKDARETVALMRSLPPHRDVLPALRQLRDAGFRLATLTNSAGAALADQLKHAGLSQFFEAALSVEEVGMYKPHAHVYRWAARRLGAETSECMLVAAHGWDLAGAGWAGMRTAFIARPGQQIFPLGPPIDLVLDSLEELPARIDKL